MPPNKKRRSTDKKYSTGSSERNKDDSSYKKKNPNKNLVCNTEAIVDVTTSTCPPSLNRPPVKGQPEEVSPETVQLRQNKYSRRHKYFDRD